MKIKENICLIIVLFFSISCFSQDWRDRMDSLVYTPKYFGPNAFPIPEINTGKISMEYQAEVRYDYHHAKGDNAQDFYVRGYLPFGTKAGLEVSATLHEYYNTSEAIRDERHAANTEPYGSCHGDLIVNSMFQVLESDDWFDAMVTAGLKTASGNMLVDARYTDAATYWFNLNLGKNIVQSEKRDSYLRLAGMVGFYCYMSNLSHHRQNDAWLLGGGFQSRLHNVYLDADLRGFQGYWDQGDHPLLVHAQFKYRYKNHSLYFRYQEGLDDYLYRSTSFGYVFSFKL